MQKHNVLQGSPEWLALREGKFTASEAPVMMGCHPNMKRDELLEAKATKTPKEFSQFVEEVIFEEGHETERRARPIVEKMTGDDLFPVVGTEGKYLASFDGLDMFDTTGFEHKQWNKTLPDMVRRGALPDYIYWQLEHQFLVCPTMTKIYFVVSDGTPDNFEHLVYESVPERREALLRGWDQFEQDLENWEPVEAIKEVKGVKPETMPALSIRVEGDIVVAGNLEEYRDRAFELIQSVNTDLQTDQDFADADAAVKWFAEAEKKIDVSKDGLLGQTVELDEVMRTLDDIKARMRETRLNLNSQVEQQKKARRNEIAAAGTNEVKLALSSANEEFVDHGVVIIDIKYDMYEAIKGKKNLNNMRSAVNDEVARAKIQITEKAQLIRKNLKLLGEKAKDHAFLFPNKQNLVYMDHDHLSLMIDNKINAYKQEQQAKADQEKSELRRKVDAIKAGAAMVSEDCTIEQLEAIKRRMSAIDFNDYGELSGEVDIILSQEFFNKLERILQEKKRALSAAQDATSSESKDTGAAGSESDKPLSKPEAEQYKNFWYRQMLDGLGFLVSKTPDGPSINASPFKTVELAKVWIDDLGDAADDMESIDDLSDVTVHTAEPPDQQSSFAVERAGKTAEEKIQEVLDLLNQYGATEEAHHLRWVVDNIVRILLTEEEYQMFLNAWEQDGIHWDEGVAP